MAKPIGANDPARQRDNNGQLKTVSTSVGTVCNQTEPQLGQTTQQERDLIYYRKFVQDLVAVMRDARSESVTKLIALIRSGASHNDIQKAVERTLNEI